MAIDKIKIGTRDYNIVKQEEIIQVGGTYYGTHDVDEQTITIASKYNQQQQNETFLHELMHAIACMQDLNDLNKDEHTIELIAKGLSLVFKDNPHIFTMVDI